MIAGGLVALTYSPLSLVLVVPGMFMAFTYNGTLIDTEKKRIKPYTALFGIYRAGKWIGTEQFTGFSIIKATKKYTTYSRGSVRFDMSVSDLELVLIKKNSKDKVVLKRFGNFIDARKEMEDLTPLIFPEHNIKQ
jgi:hypothetical protein